MKSIKAAAQQQSTSLATKPSSNTVKFVRNKPTPEKMWEFSFRFFRQIDKFGLSGTGIANDWLISLIERLRSLSQEKIENIVSNRENAEAYRYHPINWGAINIPIKRNQLDWISARYKDNPEDFPIEQLMLSKGTGRFVGFFDENWVFNIVLLDPLHNLQPAKGFQYQVNSCKPLSCELTQLQMAVRSSISHCNNPECRAAAEITQVALNSEKGYGEAYGILLLKVPDPQHITDANQLIKDGKAKNLEDIFEAGLCSIISK